MRRVFNHSPPRNPGVTGILPAFTFTLLPVTTVQRPRTYSSVIRDQGAPRLRSCFASFS